MIVSVTYDDTAEDAADFMKEEGYEFLALLDDREDGVTGPAYQVGPIPTLLLIDRDGKITYRHVGYSPGDEEELEAEIKRALGPPA